MKTLITKNLLWTIWISIGIYFACAAYEFDEISLEEMFLEYHWGEYKNGILTPKRISNYNNHFCIDMEIALSLMVHFL